MQLNGSEILMECLLEQGVTTVFGYPGGAVLNIYDALYKYSDRIRHVLTAHEQGAAHAADGYARSTGKVGVCIATSGPGATNLVTGLATAYMDSVPVVAITGNVSLPLLGRDSFQEVDITGITMPITKHNFLVRSIEELPDTIRQAFEIAQSGRQGPVLIDIPKDISGATDDFTAQPARGARTPETPKADRIAQTVQALADCKKPLIYYGGGVISAEASDQLLALAERCDIPVCSSLMGLGAFPADHRLWLGMVGMHGTRAANLAAKECDLLLVLGARFSDRVAGNRSGFAPNAAVIHLDVDHAEFDKNVATAVRVAGDLKQTLSLILDGVSPASHPDWVQQTTAAMPPQPLFDEAADCSPDPAYILRTLREMTDDDTILVTDVGQHQMWAAQHYQVRGPRRFLTSGGLGTMGYGLGAAIGAAVANPDKRVVLITGDGSFHMNCNELATLAGYELPVTVVLMNNRVLGMVRQWQKVFYASRFSATDPHRKTDFVALAQAYGVQSTALCSQKDVRAVLQQALQAPAGFVVDCRISPDANVLPMIPPGQTVEKIIEKM